MRTRLLLISWAVGAAAAFVVFALFLQTAAVSLVRLATVAALFVMISAVTYRLTIGWLVKTPILATRALMFGLGIAAVFLPLLFPRPQFPASPLLRPWADLAIQYDVPASSGPLQLPANSLKLTLGRDVLNEGAFIPVGAWEKTSSGLQLAAGTTGALQWSGTIPPTTTVSIQPPSVDCTVTIYWNGSRISTQIHASNASQVVVVEKTPIPWGYELALFLSSLILLGWSLTVVGVLVASQIDTLKRLTGTTGFLWGIGVLTVLLTALTVYGQVNSLSQGLKFLDTVQLVRHADVLQGRAPDPWQYRPLSEWLAEGFVRLAAGLSAPNPIAVGFLSLRIAQNVAIFGLAFGLYGRLSGSRLLALLGILLLAASMANAYYDNDLAFNTYFDVLLYLLAGSLLLAHRYQAVIIVTFFAAFNRETSAVMPFLMTAAILSENPRVGLRKLAPAILAMAVFAAVFVGLRAVYPDRPLYVPYKHPPGVPLLLYNLTRQFTWSQLWKTLGVAPLLGVAFLPVWPRLWKWFFLILCPIWFVIHAFAAVMAETRLFLVPQALIFIPGALFVFRQLMAPDQQQKPALQIQGAAS